jgi:peptidyl-prolyl cis-trans isomerase SurA
VQQLSKYFVKKTPFPFLVLVFLPVLGIFASLTVFPGCGGTASSVLAVVGADTIRVADFERQYVKLRNATPESPEQKEEFLNLLVDYRLKVKEAEARGIASLPDVKEDIARYRDQLAVSFLVERGVVEPAIQTLYQRRREEIKASHILVRNHRDANNQIDSVSTREEAEKVLAAVLASHESFDSLVMRYSEDGAKTKTRGNLGWAFAGTSLPELDDMLYDMKKVGEISPRLLKSNFGYHIMQLTGRQHARVRLRASQILYRLDINSPLDTAAGYARLSLILDSLQSGKATFEDLARRNSQDPVSGAAGGDLGWVERGTNLEARFEDALFNLPTGETSKIVRSAFGLHIIRVTDETVARPIEEQRSILRPIVMRERFANDYKNFMKVLRAKHEFHPSIDVFKRIISRTDSSQTTSSPNWQAKLSEKDLDAYLFRTTEGPYRVRDAVKEIAINPLLQMRRFTLESLDSISTIIGDYVIQLAECRGLESRAPDFAQLVREYTESAIISRLEADEVLKSTTVTDEDARAYFDTHKAEFVWPDRVNYSEIWVYSDVQAKRLLDSLNTGANFAEIASRYTRRTGTFEKGGSMGWQPVDRDDITRVAYQMEIGSISGVIKDGNGYSIVKVDGKDRSRPKTFEEVRSETLSRAKEAAVARKLKSYLQELRGKYSATVYPERLAQTFAN